ncbi:MAG: hypothetical protein II998_12525 [Clostridia bacterium]|nr:hypothetical protein [Clostridia bacterium]
MKIGLIDKYLDEWHANNLPTWLRDETDDVEEIYAYEMMPSPNDGGISGEEWAKEHGAILCNTIEEVVEKSDVLIVLAPSFPETHEEICDLPLRSGKLTYVDKTFAPDVEAAKRLIAKAKEHNTPMFSTSALRFSTQLKALNKENVATVSSRGPGPLEMYCIHQIEPSVVLMGNSPEAVMFIGTEEKPAYVIRFSGNKFVTCHQFGWEGKFDIAVGYSDGKESVCTGECTDFFENFTTELVKFFKTGKPPVDYKDTLAVIAIRETLLKSKNTPGVWVQTPDINN